MLQLDERTWGWLTNPKVKTLGLWLFFEHNREIIKQLEERLHAAKNSKDFAQITTSLLSKLEIMKHDPFFSSRCSKDMISELESVLRTHCRL
jgi:hypothetical protein